MRCGGGQEQRELLPRDDVRTREQDQAAGVLQDFSGTSSKLWAKGGSLLRLGMQGGGGGSKAAATLGVGSRISGAAKAEGLWNEGIPGFPQPLWLPTA